MLTRATFYARLPLKEKKHSIHSRFFSNHQDLLFIGLQQKFDQHFSILSESAKTSENDSLIVEKADDL